MDNMNYYDNDTLTRRDGRRMRTPQTSSQATTQTQPRATLPENQNGSENQDGFVTHIRCCWCNGLIKDVYIPDLKDGKDGKPYNIVPDYEPCPACREKWNKMVVFIEVIDHEPYADCLPIDEDIRPLDKYIDPETNPEEYAARVIHEQPEGDARNMSVVQYERVFFYPTGKYAGVTLDAVKQHFEGDTSAVRVGSVIYLENNLFEKAFSTYFT